MGGARRGEGEGPGDPESFGTRCVWVLVPHARVNDEWEVSMEEAPEAAPKHPWKCDLAQGGLL